MTISNTLSTTMDEIPCEIPAPYSCFRMNTRTRSPSRAGTIRLAVWEIKMQPVEKRKSAANPDAGEDYLVPETTEEPCEKADYYGKNEVSPDDMFKSYDEVILHPEEHEKDNPYGNQGRYQDGANLSQHGAATRAGGLPSPYPTRHVS